jgi:N-acetylglutamate synthase-like GNAT family acetyltransferase
MTSNNTDTHLDKITSRGNERIFFVNNYPLIKRKATSRRPVIIKLASRKELEEIYKIQSETRPAFPIVGAYEVLNSPSCLKFIAIDPRKTGSDRFMGYASVNISRGFPEMEKLSVRFSNLQENIGAKLFGVVIGALLKKGYKKMYFTSTQGAMGFYYKLGFRPVSRKKNSHAEKNVFVVDFESLKQRRAKSIANRQNRKQRLGSLRLGATQPKTNVSKQKNKNPRRL